MSFTERWYQFFDKPVPNFILRFIVMFIGLFFVAFGASLSRSTGLGTSTISCIPAALSFATSLTMGTYTFIMNALFVGVIAALLRRNYNPIQLLALPFVLIFATMIDLLIPVCESFPMPNYGFQLMFSILSCFSTAFGVFLQVKAALILLPGDGIVLTISRVFGTDFAKTKIGFDCTMVAGAVIVSVVTMGGLYGVREGTIIAAIITGLIIKLYGKLFKNFERFAPTQGHITLTPKEKAEAGIPVTIPEGTPLVITITREYGSGGRELGKKIAAKLGQGIKSYDHTLVDLTATESGLTPEYIRANEEEVRRGILYDLFAQNYEYVGATPSETDVLFLSQARTINRLADTENCIIVGRCANYLLSQHPNCFNIFVHAPLEARIARVMKRDGITHEAAEEACRRIDADRRDYVRTYSGHEWGQVEDYDLAVDSSIVDTDVIASMVANIINDPSSRWRIMESH